MNWEEIQQRMREARTPQEKQQAAAALMQSIPDGYRASLLSTLSKGGTNIVSLGDLPSVMAQNPEVWDRVRNIVLAGR